MRSWLTRCIRQDQTASTYAERIDRHRVLSAFAIAVASSIGCVLVLLLLLWVGMGVVE